MSLFPGQFKSFHFLPGQSIMSVQLYGLLHSDTGIGPIKLLKDLQSDKCMSF